MVMLILVFIIALASSSTAANVFKVNGTSSFMVLASKLPAGGSSTYSFDRPMLLYVSRDDANQAYDTNIRLIDEATGVRTNAWAAAQSNGAGGVKRPVFIDGKKDITISNLNVHVFDDLASPALFYFVDATANNAVYEVYDAAERRKVDPGSNASITLMNALGMIAVYDFRFPEKSIIRISAGGIGKIADDHFELLSVDDAATDSASWLNAPIPLLTVSSSTTAGFHFSASARQAERSKAKVGSKTAVMSPGYPFDSIPSRDYKYGFAMEHDATIDVEYFGDIRLETCSLSVIGSDAKNRQSFNKKLTITNWTTSPHNDTFHAVTVLVDIKHALGTPTGVLVRLVTSATSAMHYLFAAAVLLLCILLH